MHCEDMSKHEILGNTTIYGSHTGGRVKPKKETEMIVKKQREQLTNN